MWCRTTSPARQRCAGHCFGVAHRRLKRHLRSQGNTSDPPARRAPEPGGDHRCVGPSSSHAVCPHRASCALSVCLWSSHPHQRLGHGGVWDGLGAWAEPCVAAPCGCISTRTGSSQRTTTAACAHRASEKHRLTHRAQQRGAPLRPDSTTWPSSVRETATSYKRWWHRAPPWFQGAFITCVIPDGVLSCSLLPKSANIEVSGTRQKGWSYHSARHHILCFAL